MNQLEQLELVSPEEVRQIRSSTRCFQRTGYGTDGRATGVVDWYDGWDQGCKTPEPLLPKAILDKVAWLDGWDTARAEHVRNHWPRCTTCTPAQMAVMHPPEKPKKTRSKPPKKTC